MQELPQALPLLHTLQQSSRGVQVGGSCACNPMSELDEPTATTRGPSDLASAFLGGAQARRLRSASSAPNSRRRRTELVEPITFNGNTKFPNQDIDTEIDTESEH